MKIIKICASIGFTLLSLLLVISLSNCTNVSSQNTKDTITLASLSPDYDLIEQFNNDSSKYIIKINDYSKYIAADDYSTAIKKFDQDIVSGCAGDIIDFTNLPYKIYAKSEVMRDLYGFFDSDTTLDETDIYGAKALEVNGGLYAVGATFNIYSFIGKESVIGNKIGWTLNDMLQLETNLSTKSIFNDYSAEDFLLFYCMANIGHMINWETGTCELSHPDFLNALDYAYKLGSSETSGPKFDLDLLEQDKICLAYWLISNPAALYSMELYSIREEITPIGFPSVSNNGNIMYFHSLYGISAASLKPEGGWDFIRYLLSPSYQDSIIFDLPITKRAISNEISTLQTVCHSDSKEIGDGKYVNGKFIESKPMSNQQAKEILELIGSLDSIYIDDPMIYDIILDETRDFFSGTKTQDITIMSIQAHVSKYLKDTYSCLQGNPTVTALSRD